MQPGFTEGCRNKDCPSKYFNNFFYQKILNTPNRFPSSTLSQGIPLVEESCMSMMDKFKPLSETNIIHLLRITSKIWGS